jgi:predicted dehydrogenase
VQKPIALSSIEANAMIEVDKAGVLLRMYENFVYYAPVIRTRQMIEDREIGAIRTVRLHVSTGMEDSSWNAPLSAWLWRFTEKQCGDGLLVFDHGCHLFSVAFYLGGPV